MKTISTKNEIKKFGLYTAFFTVSFSVMQAVLGTHYENDTTSNIVGLLIYFLLLTNVIEPTFWDTTWNIAYEVAIEQNPEQMTNPESGEFWTKEEFISYLEWTKNLVYPFTIVSNLFVGFMFSLLLGLIIKKS